MKVINEYGYARASQSCGEKFCQGEGIFTTLEASAPSRRALELGRCGQSTS